MRAQIANGDLFPALRPESQDMLHLDALRLVAACGVVMVHLSGFLMRSAIPQRFGGFFHNLTLFVDMFFAVSGYVIAWVYFDRLVDWRSFKDFFRKRIARLVPLHWATLAIYVAMGLFVAFMHIPMHQDKGMFEWHCLPANALLLHATGICADLTFNAPSWSISAEMIMYLATPLMFWVLRRRPWVLGLAAAALVAVLTFYGTDQNAWLFWTASGGCIRAIPSFAFGMLVFTFRDAVTRLPFARYGFWLTLLGFFWSCAAGVSPIASLLCLYAGVMCAVAADAQGHTGRIIKFLAAGGQLTYSSYMLHTLIINVILNAIADRVLHLQGAAVTLMALLAFALIWPISYLSLVFLEKPARRLLTGSHPRPGARRKDTGVDDGVAVAPLPLRR